MPTLASLACAVTICVASAAGGDSVPPFSPISLDEARRLLASIAAGPSPASAPVAGDDRIALALDGEPLACIQSSDALAAKAFAEALPQPAAGELKAWRIRFDAAAWLRRVWPIGAPLRTRVGPAGPGQQGAWVECGAQAGVQLGDAWWVRVQGQPIARLVARAVGPRETWCSVIPLSNAAWPLEGRTTEAWPSPGAERLERAASAVCLVESDAARSVAWIAAPPRCSVPTPTRVDFYRRGEFITSGEVERRDARFWYVRVRDPAGGLPAVGDDAVIRTVADVRQRRFTAHVMESGEQRFTVDAGESESIRPGDTCWVAGERERAFIVARVQSGYCEVIVQDGAPPPPGAPIRFGEDRDLPKVGRVRGVVSGCWFAAELETPTSAPAEAVLVGGDAGDQMAALVVWRSERELLAFVPPECRTRDVAIGDEVRLDESIGAP